tara:strand:+ start:149 stop:310 length:162 start_codon:yes stop_codon:yes gene_type:complete
MSKAKPQALRIRRRKVERRQRKEERRIARELDRLYIASYPLALLGEPTSKGSC